MAAIPSTPLSFLDAGRVLLKVSPGTPLPVTDFLMELRRGNVPGASVTHKFGSQVGIAATYSPITTNAIYQTPQVSGATALRIKAGNANDTAAGSGAREITLQGLNENGVKVDNSQRSNQFGGTDQRRRRDSRDRQSSTMANDRTQSSRRRNHHGRPRVRGRRRNSGTVPAGRAVGG